ncbi:MAG: caspase family protein [Anaerolineae bacterium]|nr:caspase family protein [Anaerolineae bacterium]
MPQTPPVYQSIYNSSYALLIGINAYADPRFVPLGEAEHDANALAGALRDTHGFQAETILGASATKSAILQALYHLRDTTPDDRVLIYFACHGYTLTDRFGSESGYLATADTIPEQDFTALHLEEIVGLRRHAQAKHIAFIFDACFSGQALGLTRATSATASKYLERRAYQVLSAGAGDQTVSDFNSMTDVMVAALTNPALARDGILTMSNLGLHVQQTMASDSGQTQIPQFGHLRGSQGGEFVFYQATGPHLPDDIEMALQSGNPHVRWGAVSALVDLVDDEVPVLEEAVSKLAFARLNQIAGKDSDERVAAVARSFLEINQVRAQQSEGSLDGQEASARLEDLHSQKAEAEHRLKSTMDADVAALIDPSVVAEYKNRHRVSGVIPLESTSAPAEEIDARVFVDPAALRAQKARHGQPAPTDTSVADLPVDAFVNRAALQKFKSVRIARQQVMDVDQDAPVEQTAEQPVSTAAEAPPPPDMSWLKETRRGSGDSFPAIEDVVRQESAPTTEHHRAGQAPAKGPLAALPLPLLVGGALAVLAVIAGLIAAIALLSGPRQQAALTEASAIPAEVQQPTVPVEAAGLPTVPPTEVPVTETATTAPATSTPPSAAVGAPAGLILRDTFDDPAFRDTFNPALWEMLPYEADRVLQEDGALSFWLDQGIEGDEIALYSTAPAALPAGYTLYATARIRLTSDTETAEGGYGETKLTLLTPLSDGRTLAYSCIAGRQGPAFVVCTVATWDTLRQVFTTVYNAGYTRVNLDNWHTFRIEVDDLNRVTFSVDGQVIAGEYRAPDAALITGDGYRLGLFAYSETGEMLVGQFDNVEWGRAANLQ